MDQIFLTSGQFEILCRCFAAGVFAGACYSLARAVSKILGSGRIATIVTDAVWGLAAAAIAAFAGLEWAGGEIRAFWIAGFCLGVGAYCLTLHKLLAKFGEKVYNLLKPKLDAYRARFRKNEESPCENTTSTPSDRRRRRPAKKSKKEKTWTRRKDSAS